MSEHATKVKVGQAYAINYSGSEAVVIAVDSESACVNRIGKYPDSGLQIFPLEEFKKFRLIRSIELREVSNKKKSSDLEIVQKALEKVNRSTGNNITLTRYAGGDWAVEELIEGSRQDEKITLYTTSSTKDLLTWAKQTIGVE